MCKPVSPKHILFQQYYDLAKVKRSQHLCDHGDGCQLSPARLADQVHLAGVPAMEVGVVQNPSYPRVAVPHHVQYAALDSSQKVANSYRKAQ